MKGVNVIVVKRDQTVEPFDMSKWQRQIEKMCEGVEDVSPIVVIATAQAQFNEKMTTEELDEIALRSMVNLIDSEENPIGDTNYEIVAGRQRITMLRKKLYGGFEPWSLLTQIKFGVNRGFYTADLLEWYTEEEINYIDENILDHSIDMTHVFSQVEQFTDKYLVRDRSTNEIYETPQMRYIIAAMTGFHMEDRNAVEGVSRMDWIRDAYAVFSQGEATLSTPVAGGLGTPTKQFSSCVTITSDDDMDSIYASGWAMAKYAGKRAGIGLEIGRIRAVGSPIRNGEIKHTGLIPFVQKWVKDLRSVSQGGLRTGSATVSFPIWHLEFESLVVLKNNQGTDETRVRQLDYSVQTAAMFWERLVTGRNITLFSPSDVPGLYEAFHRDIKEFERIYVEAEANPLIRKKVISADEALRCLTMTERSGTGRIYLNFEDNIQFQTAYNVLEDPVVQSNLCQEIFIPSSTFTQVKDSEKGLIGLCTLGSINWGKMTDFVVMRRAVRVLYRMLHNLLQYQEFLVPQSARHNEMYEPIGIGVTGLAQWHAQRGFVYGEDSALAQVKSYIEHQYFYMMEMNVELAKLKGACKRSHATKYAEGKLIFDLRHPNVDTLTNFDESPDLDYKKLRADLIKYGCRNTTTGALPPVESSSVLVNSTNGIALIKSLISSKTSRASKIVQVVPEYKKYKENYERLLMWKQPDPVGYLKTVAVLQVYTDQGISADMFYNPKEIINETTKLPEMRIDVTEVMSHHIMAMNWGIKSLYYFLVNKQAFIDRLKIDNGPAIVFDDAEYCENCVL